MNQITNAMLRDARVLDTAVGFPTYVPEIPDSLVQVRAQQAANGVEGNGRDSSWTGLSLIREGSAKEVRESFQSRGDAGGAFAFATNADMYSVRFAYGSKRPMENWVLSRPSGGTLKMRVALTPSWHVGESEGKKVAKQLLSEVKMEGYVPVLKESDVLRVLAQTEPVSTLAPEEMGAKGLQKIAKRISETFDVCFPKTKEEAKTVLEQLLIDVVGELYAEQFAKENRYKIVVRVDGAEVAAATFDVDGKESFQAGGRSKKSRYCTLSPVVELDYDKLQGRKVELTAFQLEAQESAATSKLVVPFSTSATALRRETHQTTWVLS